MNTKNSSRKWHKLYKEFSGETPILMKARCGFKCSVIYATEIYRTLVARHRCDKSLKEDEPDDA